MGRLNLIFISSSILVHFWLGIGDVGAIIGGFTPRVGEYPYIVAVYAHETYLCVGTAIGRKHVLAAGHCVIDQSGLFLKVNFRIVVGVVKLDVPNNFGIVFDVTELYVPREYTGITTQHHDKPGDLLVLKIDGVLNLDDEHIVHLPSKTREGNSIPTYPNYVSRIPTVFGFGTEKQLAYQYSTVIRERDCIMKSRATVNPKHICAQIAGGNSRAAVCYGDYGAPLIITESSNNSRGSTIPKQVVIGILVHFSPTCKESADPPLYTRISSFVPFIEQAINGIKDLTTARIATYRLMNIPGTSSPTRILFEMD